jgi:DNA-directed RNA polymerase
MEHRMNALADYAVEKTAERFARREHRAMKNAGFGAQAGALGITERYLSQLSTHINQALLERTGASKRTDGLFRVLRQLDPDLISLCTLQTALHSVCCKDEARDTCLGIGNAIAGECWAAKLLQHNGKLAAKIERAVRRKHGRVDQRRTAAKAHAKAPEYGGEQAGFRVRHWSKEQLLLAGEVLLGWLLSALPEVFEMEEGQNDIRFLVITDGANDIALAAVDHCIANNPVFMPTTVRPVPWRDFSHGGYANDGRRARADVLLRTTEKATVAAVNAAARDGSLQPFLDAVNAVQDVPWKINQRVLGVLRGCIERGIAVGKSLPQPTDIPKPERGPEVDEDEGAGRLWRYKFAQVKQKNRVLKADRLAVTEDVKTAERLAEHERFWTPVSCDWRGRVYPLSHFNFQRDDRVRALFQFADGAPIGTEGLYWLKVHLANCGDFDKISKRPFEERVAWVNSNMDLITATAEVPLQDHRWTKADKPFLFLSACMELVSAIAAGPAYVTYLPVSFDGSCSGLQHLCAMTRAPEGTHVNLTSSSIPQDVYQVVADLVRLRVEADVEIAEVTRYAQLWLKYGIDRKLVKRNVMTFAYSSKKFGMGKQHMEDLMKPLRFEVLEGKHSEHPFGDNEEEQKGAASYLAAHVYQAISEVVGLPAQAMGFLQGCARALAHEGKPLSWKTPLGLPWCNRYHEIDIKRVSLWLHDVRIRVKLATGSKKTIDKSRSANGVAPNLVHACDANHLLMTASAAAAEGIHIATVHDSFGCLAPHATRFNQIIREQFVSMYETHDVLAEVLEQATCDLTVHNLQRLPELPTYGNLDVKEVLNAPFAFA